MKKSEDVVYKTETHLHTAESSFCGMLTAREMVEAYHEAGYKTVVVTDHLTKLTFEKYSQDDWESSVDRYLRGYREAKRTGDKIGMNIILGAEVSLVGVPNDYLAYGITREFMISHPYLYNLSREEFYKEAKAWGILVIQAHPMRDRSCIPTPDTVDGFEVYNSNPRHDDYSDEVRAIAEEYGIYMTSGSDAHRADDACISGIITDREIVTAEDLIEAIKSRKIELIIPKK